MTFASECLILKHFSEISASQKKKPRNSENKKKTLSVATFYFVDLHSLRYLLDAFGTPDANDVESFLALSEVIS